MLFRYFDTQEKQQKAREAQRVKEDKYKRVLERAKAAEREEKLFKAQTGHIPSQLSLAKEFELCNLREALYWYLKAAEQNNAIAQNALARLCRMDMEDPEGEAKSRYWEQVLKAQQREPAALYDLGRYQIRGQGTEIDTETGVSNVEAAADAGWLPAQLFLGDWFLSEKNSHKIRKRPSCGVCVPRCKMMPKRA
ncbi:TPR repeat protein SEL1 subfamily [Photobacterium aphoticum]|uniref:TPR repeat protein SEL1 subfamily n=1 Tax=Photobacterium aphoticum TaxID=754436 RepID=A0A090QNH9_9GAMM|nr:TPR repeat protein SEL1 subfamily [Photobacterium aphoticum]